VPLYAEDNADNLQSYVRQRDLFRELLKGNRSSTLKDLARPLQTVPELMKLDQLLLQMFEDKEHICAVVDEHGALAGVITLEDVLEEIVGREIVDEYDLVKKKGARLSDLARTRHHGRK
jgi:CBS domain containing-hemolysin-like protein